MVSNAIQDSGQPMAKKSLWAENDSVYSGHDLHKRVSVVEAKVKTGVLDTIRKNRGSISIEPTKVKQMDRTRNTIEMVGP